MACERLDIEQAANYLAIDRGSLMKRVREGGIPFAGGDDDPVFSKDDLDAWASAQIMEMDGRRLERFERGADGADAEAFPLYSLVSPERVFLDVEARTKASILSELVSRAESLGLLYDPRDLLESLRAREALCSTALTGGAAIPHPRHHDPYLAQESFLIVARPSSPIHFGAPDGKPSDLFFLLVCQDDRRHLRALARLCSILADPRRMATLRAADAPGEICAALKPRA
ncbi:MAG: PTS sugar transporter subunit IIA [Kiritimatiellae bacterium]|nr:PTS sugar transporter subunit IIA [Kiritimatiellia bacterium]